MSLSNAGLDNLKGPERDGRIVVAGRVEELPPGRGAAFEIPGGPELALYNVEGQFYAVENFCPHRGAPIAEGRLCGHIVECAWHGWLFDVRRGECLTTGKPIESYKVFVEDGLIKINLTDFDSAGL